MTQREYKHFLMTFVTLKTLVLDQLVPILDLINLYHFNIVSLRPVEILD